MAVEEVTEEVIALVIISLGHATWLRAAEKAAPQDIDDGSSYACPDEEHLDPEPCLELPLLNIDDGQVSVWHVEPLVTQFDDHEDDSEQA